MSIDNAVFKQDYRCFQKGQRFDFDPGVNLLVGDQGVGKSSLLELIRKRVINGDKDVDKIVKISAEEEILVRSFDFEKDNPRTLAYFRPGLETFQVQSKFMSHGQVVKAIHASMEATPLIEGLKELKKSPSRRKKKQTPTCWLMDEPDTGLSPRSAYAFAEQLQKMEDRGDQVIAAVHNPIVISEFRHVLSLEHRTRMTSEKFLADMRKPMRPWKGSAKIGGR